MIAPILNAQQSFSWFGNQILTNETVTIPGRKTYLFHFDVSVPARVRIDAESAGKEELDTYLMTKSDYDAAQRAGKLTRWMENVEGPSAQIVSSIAPGEYAVVILNALTSTQNVSLRVWVQKQ